MQDLWRLSAAEMASLIRSKKVSAKEAATAALARLDAVNPKINAVVDHRPDDVLAQALRRPGVRLEGEDAAFGTDRPSRKEAVIADVRTHVERRCPFFAQPPQDLRNGKVIDADVDQ